MIFNNTNPEAFKKVIDFIYHKSPFKVKRGCLGSSFSYIKLVLEVLCLAVKFKLPKLVKFCEDVVEKKITVTSANCQQVLRPNTICVVYFSTCYTLGAGLPFLHRGCDIGGQKGPHFEV